MQEWCLSRRFVWANTALLYWKCRDTTESELGPYPLMDIPRFEVLVDNWHLLMKSFPRMQLTYESDRLVALRGIVAALKECFRRDVEYHFGVWLDGDEAPLLLLWEKTNHHKDLALEKCHQNIPSWSWASVPDDKVFSLSPMNTFWNLLHTWHYYDSEGFTAESNGTELHFRARVGLVRLLLDGNCNRYCEENSTTRYRRMSICIPTSDSNGADSQGVNGAVTVGVLTLDYTVDVQDFPTTSGIAHHVIPLVRRPDGYDIGSPDIILILRDDHDKCTSSDYMLVVEPVDRPDGSKAYRRVGVGVVKQEMSTDVEWSCWQKMVFQLEWEDIVLI
ncbi:hypothetical protein B0T20DRAFT_406569 [Sordaria brevicollis]|uniref:Uncharacterized protein n=1 Tax=Sordaria brevicollis TaxID=83679 RepID=A0AAE0PGL2_SORBR|nr:hypothetical protein B0T20DRAFT_406569 [Sordaria brevicollis]